MKQQMIMIIGGLIFLLFLYLLLANKPAPAAVAAGECSSHCTDHTAFVTEEPRSWLASSICGDCLIKSINYVVDVARYGYDVVCECCQCSGSYSATAGLGQCSYKISFLNEIGAWLGLCVK